MTFKIGLKFRKIRTFIFIVIRKITPNHDAVTFRYLRFRLKSYRVQNLILKVWKVPLAF